jgi:hypothetical protein
MSDYRPTPYMAALIARLDGLCAIRRSLTDAERIEVQRLNRSLRWAKWHQSRYRSDPAFREVRQKRARDYWRTHARSGASA